ncbi:hypothetical protein V6O07_05040, partial [Arthrospira platensis SPKY2]
MALSGDDIDFNNKDVWNKYRPYANEIISVNPFYINVELNCPWNCSTADMRRFKWIGYDLIIGYGEPDPDMTKGGYFLRYKDSFVIDGFHNLNKVNIDSYNANDTINVYNDIWLKNDSDVIKDEFNNDQYIDYNGRKRLTWGLVKTILREGTAMYVRAWVRSRGVSDTKPHTTSGYLYAGYDNFDRPGQYGHTFNKGLLAQTSRPQ